MMMSAVAWILLFAFLAMASAADIRFRRIPNGLVFPGMAAGFLLTWDGFPDFGWKLLMILFLYFFGMLGLMGMGDLKLWMMEAAFAGAARSTLSVLLASLFLMAGAFIRHRKEAVFITQATLQQLRTHTWSRLEQTSYPFAPYMAAGMACVFLLVKTGRA